MRIGNRPIAGDRSHMLGSSCLDCEKMKYAGSANLSAWIGKPEVLPARVKLLQR
jgi:hypothetical protein